MGNCVNFNEADFPASYIINGIEMRVHVEWRSCGHKETRNTNYVRCVTCYPYSTPKKLGHGPYYIGSYWENDKKIRVYVKPEVLGKAKRLRYSTRRIRKT
jgi:hypothetical protein